jgi:hypothetical protein
MRKRLAGVLDDVGSHGQELVIELLRSLAKKQGMMFAKRSDTQITVAQSVALRDHVRTGTNGLYRIKQAIELFCPALRGTTQVEVMNARTQSNLNGDIMQEKIVLKTGITGKKRGPQKSVIRGWII